MIINQSVPSSSKSGDKIVYGTYTGDGNSYRIFTFDSKPLAFMTQRLNGFMYGTKFTLRGQTTTGSTSQNSTSNAISVTWSDTTIRFDGNSDSKYNFNANNEAYAYIVILE